MGGFWIGLEPGDLRYLLAFAFSLRLSLPLPEHYML